MNRSAHNYSMKVARLIAVSLAMSVPASAILPTIDAASLLQLGQAYRQGTAQLTQLGSIVGLGQDQLATARTIETAIGVARGTINPQNLTLSQLAHLSQGLGVDASGALSKVFQQAGPFAGALDVFMGSTLQSFTDEQSGPLKAFSTNATTAALNSLGMAAGLNGDEISLMQNVARMTPDQRARNSRQISLALARMADERYIQGAEQRRLAIQAEANMAQAAAKRASEARTLNETAAAGGEIAAAQARLAALQAQQANEANELLRSQGAQTNDALTEMNDRRAREAAEARLYGGGKP